MNIAENLTRLLGSGESLNSISSALGLGRDETARAVSSAVPSLLAAFTQTASTDQGAQQLANAASQQDPGMLDNLSQSLSSNGTQIAQQGSGLLNSILGGGQTSALSSGLARFTGVGEGAMGKVMALLSPIILGFLGRQSGGGAAGIANLLKGQKDHIQSAMPSGLSSLLPSGMAGLGNLFGGTNRDDRTTVGTAPSKFGSEPAKPSYESQPPPPSYQSRNESTHSAARWVVPALVALALIAGFLMWNRRDQVYQEPITTARTTTTNLDTTPTGVGGPAGASTGAATSGNFVSETSSLITNATQTITGIRDSSSADAAVESLRDINRQLESSRSTWTSLPASAKISAQNTLTPLVNRLESASQSVMNRPGVGEKIQPQVEELMNNLRPLTSQAAPPPPNP